LTTDPVLLPLDLMVLVPFPPRPGGIPRGAFFRRTPALQPAPGTGPCSDPWRDPRRRDPPRAGKLGTFIPCPIVWSLIRVAILAGDGLPRGRSSAPSSGTYECQY